MFHRVLPQSLIKCPSAYSTFGTLISQEYFETILEMLIANGFKFFTISELENLNQTQKCVALTFDDGYSDNFDYVIPSLLKFGINASFFPIVNPCKHNEALPLDFYYQYVDDSEFSDSLRDDYIKGNTKRNFYWSNPERQKELLKILFDKSFEKIRIKYLTAEQIKYMSDLGMEIGSHSMSHSLLTADYMDNEKISLELELSKEWLENITMQSVNSFCFPAGAYNDRIIQMAKDVGYSSVVLVSKNLNSRPCLPSYDRFFVKQDSLVDLKSYLNII